MINMQDPYKAVRMRSILNPQPQGNPGLEQPRVPFRDTEPKRPPLMEMDTGADSEPEFTDELDAMRRNMPMTSAYRQSLLQQPQREAYKPSGWRRAGAALAGFGVGFTNPAGGIEAASSINEAPYRKAIEDYSLKTGALQQGAEIEAQDYNSRAKTLEMAQRLGLSAAELRNRERGTDVAAYRAETDRGNAEVNAARADAYIADLKSGNFKPVSEKGGTRMINDKDPSRSYFVPGMTVAEMQAKTQARFAATGEANVGLRRQEIALKGQEMLEKVAQSAISSRQASQRIDAMNRRIDQTAKQKKATPDQQYDAVLGAYDALSSDPDFAKFLERGPDGDLTVRQLEQEEADSPEYFEFLDALEDYVDESLEQGEAPIPRRRFRAR